MQRSLQQTIAVQALLCKSNEEKRFCFFKSRALTRKKKKKKYTVEGGKKISFQEQRRQAKNTDSEGHGDQN